MRRRDILAAARECVRRSGFHGAGMAAIAKCAGLSVGQLYRYFENKEAIIAAIVAEDLADIRERFNHSEDSAQGLTQSLLNEIPLAVERGYDPERRALVLEVCAEAARNPKVAAIVENVVADERVRYLDRLRHCRDPEWSEAEFQARIEVVAALFDGMAIRGVGNPHVDRVLLVSVMEAVVRQVLRLT